MEIRNIEMRQKELGWSLRRKQVKDEITQRKQQQWQLAQESKESYKKAYDDACKAIDKDMQAVMADLDNEQAARLMAIDKDMQAVMADLDNEQAARLMAIAKEEDDYKFEVAKYTQQLKEEAEQ